MRRVVENGGEDTDCEIDQFGIDEIELYVGANGRPKTMYPTKGDSVLQWNKETGQWERTN